MPRILRTHTYARNRWPHLSKSRTHSLFVLPIFFSRVYTIIFFGLFTWSQKPFGNDHYKLHFWISIIRIISANSIKSNENKCSRIDINALPVMCDERREIKANPWRKRDRQIKKASNSDKEIGGRKRLGWVEAEIDWFWTILKFWHVHFRFY